MDDLDHSMRMAESDWMNFYKESEECGLLQPLLACPDGSSLSDSESSGNSRSVSSVAQNQNPAANSDEAKSSAAGCCMEGMQVDDGVSGKPDTLQTKAEEDRDMWATSDTWVDPPGGSSFCTEGITTVTKSDITASLQTVQPNIPSLDTPSTELTRQRGDVPTESDPSSMHERGRRSGSPTEVNEPHRDAAASNDVDSGASTGEKERWFLTQPWMRPVSAKDKQRPKKTKKRSRVCQTVGQERSWEKGLKNDEPEGGRDQNSMCRAGENMTIMSESSQVSSASEEGSGSSGKLPTSLITEPTVDRNEQDPRSASTSRDALKAGDPPLVDGEESDEFEDSAEFLSLHSWDSESYLSASESVEDAQHPLVETQQLQSSRSAAESCCPPRLTENADADSTRDRRTLPPEDGLSRNATSSGEVGDVQHAVTFPSAAQSVQPTPDGDAPCDRDASRLQHRVDAPGLQTRGTDPSAPGCSLGGGTLTPPPAASSPEAYAAAAGQARPVYAISAFWDDMEKLTINDILQLRTCRETPVPDAQEPAAALVETSPTDHSPSVDAAEYNLTDAAAADATGSRRCSQLDESEPLRSGCEFSTSDFEEYWQFLGASWESSSDPQRTGVSPLFAHEEESTVCDGREAPVPSEECFEHQDSDAFFSGAAACPTRITKSKSVWNVQALNTEDVCVIGDADSGLYVSGCPSLEEDVLLRRSPSLGTLTPAHCLSSTTRCVSVYDPDAMSAAPLFRCTLCAFKDETSFSFLHEQCGEKTIPIFCCSHPAVRDLTFSYQDHVLRAEEVVSPIKDGALSFSRARTCRMSAAGLRGFCTLNGLLPRRRISFHDKGSIWCRGSGAWIFPAETENHVTICPSISLATEEKGSSTPALCREVIMQQRLLETIQATRQDGIFSTLKQSDMCLVCIAFASWVLRSSDPEAADAWKAVLLANVSALSAIQYLRHYLKKNPSQGDP